MSSEVVKESSEHFLLPHWADKNLNGEIEVFAQLSTKDGRRTGNGIIMTMAEGEYFGVPIIMYAVLTDFGNVIFVTREELLAMFHPPVFRMKKHLAIFRYNTMQIYMQLEREVYLDALK